MSIVILAEKPSQGRAYAEAFNNTSRKNGYIEVDDNRFLRVMHILHGGLVT